MPHRDSTALPSLDYVLGGGFVPGTVVVLAGPTNCGKSTLVMQAIAGLHLRALVVTGDEPVASVEARAHRIGAFSKEVAVVHEKGLDAVFAHASSSSIRSIRSSVRT